MKLVRCSFIFVLAFLFLALFSCRGVSNSTASTTPNSALTSSDPTVPQVGDNTMGFRVWAKSTPVATYISHIGTGAVTDNFATNCEVNSADAVKDIHCLIEGEELDLYYQGIALNYNAPSSMCSYVEIAMPYYYNKAAGNGPATANDNTNGSSVHGGVAIGATNESCIYKYKDANGNDAENCCLGSYTLTTWSQTASGPGFDTGATTVKKWDGAASNCLAGPAKKLLPLDKVGVPRSMIYYVENTGIRGLYDIPSPTSLDLGSNIFISNFFNPADHPVTGGVPLAYKPIAAIPTVTPNQNYVFSCLDRSYDVLARITLAVREWNARSEFLIGATGNPDTTGVEPTFGTPINDRNDLKDLGNAYPSE